MDTDLPPPADRAALEDVARRWLSLWSAPVDWALFERLHAPGFVDHSPGGRPPTREAFAQGIAALIAAFPDLVTVADDLVVDERAGRVAVRWSSTGTNRARYLGVGPTNRATRITGIEIVEIRAGQVVRRWGEWDIGDHLRG